MKRLAFVLVALTLVASCGGGSDAADDATTDAPDSTETSTTVSSDTTSADIESTTTAGDVDQGGTSNQDNPIPAGDEQTIGDFTVSVVGWEPDATQAVLDESEFNQPPEDGFAFALVTLRFRYNGAEDADPWVDLMWGATGDSGEDRTEGTCNTYPDSMFDVGDMNPGDEGESNVCLIVATDDENLVFWMHPTVSTGERTYFQLP